MSDFETLTRKLTEFAHDDNVAAGIRQLDKCIDARDFDIQKILRLGGTRSSEQYAKHELAIQILMNLLTKYEQLRTFGPESLATVSISYNKPMKEYVIKVNDEQLFLP